MDMVQKKNTQDAVTDSVIKFTGYVLLVVVALAYVPFVLSPVIFLAMYLYNHMQYISVDSRRKEYFFWLTKSERQLFKEKTEAYEKALRMKAYAEMAMEKDGIRLNQDGQFSVRNCRSRDLKSYLDRADSLINRLGPELEELSNRPGKQRSRGKRHYSNAYAFGLSLPVLFCSICVQLHTLDVTVVAEQVQNVPEIGYRAIGSMLAVGGVIKMICSVVFSAKNCKPPAVTKENVDSYLIRMIQKRKAKEIAAKREQIADAGKSAGQYAVEQKSADTEKQSLCDEPYEKSMFRIWAGLLKKKGYLISGNWENWDSLDNCENCSLLKNVSVEVSISQVNLLAAIEYDSGSNRIYFGITKHVETDSVSRDLLNSSILRQFMKENGMTLKNNEWWYCLRYSTFDNVFSQYERMLNNICRMT